MRTKTIPGAIYADLTIEGDFSGMITGLGVSINREDGIMDFPLPLINGRPEDLMFYRMHRFTNIFFAGKGNASGIVWVRNTLNKGYQDLSLGFGNNPVAFWKGFIYIVRDSSTCEVFHLSDFSPYKTIKDNIGTQGIRYINDQGYPVWGDATYDGSKTIGIAQYTTLNDVSIGQSYVDGMIAVYDNKRKVINPGPHEFIRAYRAFDSFGAASVFLPKHQANFFWFDISELDSFKDETKAPPVVITPPIEVPVDKLLAPNLIHLVEDTIREHPEVDRGNESTRGKIVDFFCIKANNGSSKPWGRKSRNREGTNLNTDAAVFLRQDGRHEIYDILNGNPPFGATWDGPPPNIFNPGENGFWTPASSSSNPGPIEIENPDLTEIEDKLNRALDRIELMQQELAQCIKDGSKIAIKSESGHYLCAELGGKQDNQVKPSVREAGNANFTRDGVGGWETHTVVKR